MKLLFAQHLIHHCPSGDGKFVVQEPGHVFEAHDNDVKDLTRVVGESSAAARLPTEQEVQLYSLATGKYVAKKEPRSAATPKADASEPTEPTETGDLVG